MRLKLRGACQRICAELERLRHGATESALNPRIRGRALLDEDSRFMAGKAALVPLPLGVGAGLL